ncbi:hypothetical protein [Streptomyces sp. NPDC004296]
MTLGELLALADDQDRAAFENLSLGYTETTATRPCARRSPGCTTGRTQPT